MNLPFFLIVTKNGSVRTVKSKPDLRWDEISIFVRLKIPDALFQKPSLQAQITIPEDAATPNNIDADVQENVRDAIEQATGMEVKISFIPPET